MRGVRDGEQGPGPDDWVFDVLRDMLTYAQPSDLPALAARRAATIAVAEVDTKREQAAATGQALVRSGSGRLT